MTRYEYVLFDLDHTLFDSDRSERDAYMAAMSWAGVSEPARYFDTYRTINRDLWSLLERGGIALEELRTRRFEELASATREPIDPVAVADEYSEFLGAYGDLYPGAGDVVNDVSKAAATGLVTNGVSRTQRARIARCGLDDVFSSIVVSGEFGSAKPGTAIFDEALRQLGDPPRTQVLMVGDSLTSDMAGANNSDIAACWYNPAASPLVGEVRIEHEISALSELLLILG